MSAGRHNGGATCWGEREGGGGGSANCVGPAIEPGEDEIIRETCWARSVKVTENVTVTEREKLNGVTETCTRRVETREITREETEITETREMGTVEGRLHGTDGVKDAHIHTEVVEDSGVELAERVETRCGQLVVSFGNEGR